MSSQLQHIADIITNAASWNQAQPDAEGMFRFSLEGGLDFSLLSPDGRNAVLLADLGPAPDGSTAQSGEELHRIASLAAASLKKRRSTLALAENRLELQRSFPTTLATTQEICPEVRDFLNDLAWWKKQLDSGGANSSSTASSSPFSFSLGGWFNS